MMRLISTFRVLMIAALSLMVGLAVAANPKADYDRGVGLAAQGKFTEAQAAFEQALKSDPPNTPVKRCLGVLADVREGRLKEQTGMHLFRGLVNFNLYRTDEAIKELTKAVELDPGYALTYAHRGEAYEDKGQSDRALADYNQALKINPRYTTALLDRGALFAKQNRLDQAMTDFDRAVAADPRNVEAYYTRGNLRARQGGYDQAIADYNRALELNPGYGHAYVRKGLTSEKAGRPREALAAYQAYLQKVNLQNQDPRQVQFVRDKIESLQKQP